jgi:hypothetical protein
MSRTLLILQERHSARVIDQLYQHDPGHLLEWEGVLDAPSLFLDQSDLVVDLQDVLFCCYGVDGKNGHEILELFKLVVHQDCAYLESSLDT